MAAPAAVDHESRPIPESPPDIDGFVEWAEEIDGAADAWEPELRALLGELCLGPRSRALDGGCGPGRITGWLADLVVPGGRVNGVDLDLPTLEYAAWSLGRDGRPGRDIELGLADVEDLPFPDRSFDAAWCASVLGYLDAPERALRELVRVVRPGGRVVALTGDAARSTFLPIEPALESRLRAAERRAARGGAWGGAADLYLGRRLYRLVRDLPVASVRPVTVTWDRVAPLRPEERAYLHTTFGWLADASSRRWLGRDWDACRRLFDPDSSECLLDRPDLHVVQTATAAVITV